MSGIRSNVVGDVWLVWNGPGGHVFQVCATRRDAAKYKRYHRHEPGIAVIRFDVWKCEDWR